MELLQLIPELTRTPSVVSAIVTDLPLEAARWRPAPGAWSVLEIVAHLADEEAEDFRTRLRLTLENPEEPWPRIDPEGWVQARRYQERELGDELERFRREREDSLEWLETLARTSGTRDWERAHEHPALGTLRAGDLLAAWVAHDALHLRQLVQRAFQRARQMTSAFETRYAGDW